MQNLEVVQAMYSAFARGDVPALVAAMDPQIEWQNPGSSQFPYFGTHLGPEAVTRNIFGFLAENLRFEKFEPKEFFSSADKVVVLLECEAVAVRTGKRVAQSVVHVFTLRAGKVLRFQDFQNSFALAQAL